MNFAIRSFCFLAAFLLLSGCLSTVETAKGHPYDGVWSGQLSLSIGNTTCMRRENMIIEVLDSEISGKTRDQKYKSSFDGIVSASGDVVNGLIDLGTKNRNALFTGVFAENTANGEWQSKYCKGVWDLRKVR